MILRTHPLLLAGTILALLAALPSFAPAQQFSPQVVFSRNLIPAAASLGEDVRPLESVPAVLPPPLLAAGKQSVVEPQGPAAQAIREAERRFQSGKFSLQEGKNEEARQEFNSAIDLLLEVPEDTPNRQLVEKKAEELIRLIHRYDLESFGSSTSDSPLFVQSPLPAMLDLTFPIDPRMKDKVVAQLAASSSQLPLAVNDAVLSYVNYFTSERGRRVLYAGLKRSGRYQPMISRILDEEGVPQELIHLAQAESAFLPRAVSYAAAAGMWQFIRSRGSEYNLTSSRTFDERLDPEKATRAAARHLHDLYKQLGDWHLAMAAYNCGPFCVERAVQRTGYADFWELRARNALPRQTMNYVPAILAMAIVSKNLQAYGLPPADFDAPLVYDTVKMTSDTGLALIADAADLPVSELRESNPSLLAAIAPAGYEVHVPRSRGGAVLAALDSVPAEKRAAWRLHRVASGENLASIARQYSTAPAFILAVNSHADPAFFESLDGGEVLLIPARAKPAPTIKTARARAGSSQIRASGAKRGNARVATASSKTKSRKPGRR